jgi:multidrug efflux system membrane fusion protein
MKNFNLLRSLAVAALALVLAGCSPGETPSKKSGAPVPVLVARSVAKTMPVQIQAIGNVTPYSKVTIRSQITGQLKAVHFQEGQPVRKDDLLFTIDPRPAQAALNQAAANLVRDEAQRDNAKIQFNRTQKLFTDKIASQEDFDTAKAGLDAFIGTVTADQAAVSNAQLSLAYTAIRAPVDGVAGAQLVYAGNIVKSPDDAMLTINQIHPIYVLFAVPERFLPEIKREMGAGALKAVASFEGMQGAAPVGELTFVDNTVDVTTGTIQLKATFTNTDNQLWPGQFVQVLLTLKEIANAVVVPSQAIQTGQNGNYVFVVKPDHSVEQRPVVPGETVLGETIVTSGLRADETVVTDGHLRLVPGAKVDVKTSLSNDAEPVAPAQP